MEKKKFRFVFCALISTLLIVPVIAEIEQHNDLELVASQLVRKDTIVQYEKVSIGGKTLTALNNQLLFLSDDAIGSQVQWAQANTTATNWKTTADFSIREQAFLTSRLGSRADLPIVSEQVNTAIPKSTKNWWLSDAAIGDREPKSFVDKDNGVDSGYNGEEKAYEPDSGCITRSEKFQGGLPTFERPIGTKVEFDVHYIDAHALAGNAVTCESFFYNNSCEGSPDVTRLVGEVKDELIDTVAYAYNKIDDDHWPNDYIEDGVEGLCVPVPFKSEISGSFRRSYRLSFKSQDAKKVEYRYLNMPWTCTTDSIQPAGNAHTRPVVTLQPSSIFSATTTPSDVNSGGVLDTYPDAGVGPYTLQVSEPALQVKLGNDASVSGNVITHPDDAIQNGKITIPYDMSGSTYESDSNVFISAVSKGMYAKLGSVSKNGTGSVTIDINNLAEKSDGVIIPQDISVALYQEEITPLGKTNYISSPLTITIQIIQGKTAQEKLVISNGDNVIFGENNNKFMIETTGGSGVGAKRYEMTAGSQFASINSTSGEVSVVKPGVITVKVTKDADDEFSAITASKNITIQKAPQTGFAITTNDFVIKKDAMTFQIETTSRVEELTSALVYTLLSDGEGAATMNASGLVTVIKAGTIKVSVSSPGNANYEDATASKDIVIRDLPAQTPALKILNVDEIVYGTNQNKISISTSGGAGNGAITSAITSGNDVASVDQATKTVTISKVGNFTLKATKSGGNEFLDSVATLNVTVKKGKQEAFQITNLGTYLIDTNPTIQVTTNMKPGSALGKLTYTLSGEGLESYASIDTNGVITTKDAGTFTIKVTAPGNELYEDEVSDTKTIILTKRIAQQPLVIREPGKLVYSQDMKFQALTSGGQGGGKVSYSISNGLNTIATIKEDTGEISIIKPGEFTLNATKDADDLYLASVATPITIKVDKIAQDSFDITTSNFVIKKDAMTFQIETTPRVDGLPGSLVYTLVSDGDGAVTMSTSGLVTVHKPGTISVSVTSVGNDYYDDKIVRKDIVISELPMQSALSITNKTSRVYGEDNNIFSIITDGGNGDGAITFAITSGEDVARVDQVTRKVTVLKVGRFTLKATKDGAGSYQDSIATLDIEVTKAPQTDFIITNEDFRILSQSSFEITHEGRPTELNSELVYDITSGKNSVATILEKVVTPLKVGEIELSITSMGNENYNNKTATKTIKITDLPEQPEFKILNSKNITYNPDNPSMSIMTNGGASDAGSITYAIQSGGTFAKIDNANVNKLTILKPGVFTIIATKDGAGKYKDSIATLEITVAKMDQGAIAIDNGNFTMDESKHFDVVVSGIPSDLIKNIAYDLTVGKGDVASISGKSITPLKTGNITISITSYGNEFYKDKTVTKAIKIVELSRQNPELTIETNEVIIFNPSRPTFKMSTQGGQGDGIVSYEIISGEGSIVGIDKDIINIIEPGSFTIKATKDGAGVYKDSVDEKTIQIGKAKQKDFKITNETFVISEIENSFVIETSGRDNGLLVPITFDLVEDFDGIAELVNDRITITNSGKIKVSAFSKGDAKYEDTTVYADIVISDAPSQSPAISITNGNVTWGDNGNKMNISYHGGQGNGALTYSIVGGNDVATNAGSVVTILKPGTFTIRVKKDGNGNYLDSEATKDITVLKKDISITPKPITKKVGQLWASVSDNGYVVEPALYANDTLSGTAVYSYGLGVDDNSLAGRYKVVMSGLNNDNYNIQFEEGILTVEKTVLTPSSAYFKVLSGTLGKNGWYTSDVVLTSMKKDGFDLLSNTLSFTSSDVTISNEGDNLLNLSLKNKNGAISEPFSYSVKIDKTKPVMKEVKVAEKNSGALAKLLNVLSFRTWFNQEMKVIFDASDNMDGEITFLYQEEINGVLGKWNSTTSNTLSYGNGSDVKVHVKAVDEAGNESSDTKVSDLIQVDLVKPVIKGVSENGVYYLPRYVSVIDLHSKVDMATSYVMRDNDKKELLEASLYNDIGEISIHAQDNAGNIEEVDFSILGLPPIESITNSDASREIVSDVEQEYAQIKDKLDPVQRQEIEDWLKNAKEASKKLVAEIMEPDTGIIVDGGEDVVFEDDVELIVEVVTTQIKQDEIVLENVSGIEEKDEIKEAYDIYLKKGDIRVQPSGMVKVKIPYTENLKSYENIKVIYIDDKNIATLYPSIIENGFITFKTSHFSYYAIVGKKSAINVDTNDDKIPDINIDIDNDGEADLNIDLDGDGIPDINIDTDFDGKPDLNIDVDNDKKADVNIIVPQKDWNTNVCGIFNEIEYCSNNELKPYLNIDSDKDGRPDINIDVNGDLEPELNIDTGNDLIPDTDIDSDGDGKADINVDINGDGIADTNLAKPITNWNPLKDCEYKGFKYDTDVSIVNLLIKDVPQEGESSNGNTNDSTVNGSYHKPSQGGIGGVATSSPTGDETNWSQWLILLGISVSFMQGTRLLKKRMERNEK